MINTTTFYFYSYIILFFGTTFLYSLYNLYIGRNTNKHKYIILSLNFAFLIAFIAFLISTAEYDQFSMLLLMIIILAIIVLGIIGGFLYNPKYSIDKSSDYLKKTKIFKHTIRGVYLLVGVIVIAFTSYRLLTHEVDQLLSIGYSTEKPLSNELIALQLLFDNKDKATLTIRFEDTLYNKEDISNIKIEFDSIIIHNSSKEEISSKLNINNYNATYTFDYSFHEIKDDNEINDIVIKITVDNTTESYNIVIDYMHKNYEKVVLPIWKKSVD